VSSDSIQSLLKQSDDENFENIQLIVIYEIIKSNSTFMRSSFDELESNTDLDLYTGKIGEQIVFEYLQEKYSSQTNPPFIKWENEKSESNLFYDILLINNGRTHYIEVKSTQTNNQYLFQLSINQIEAILHHREN
jgi:hypothetical protein